MPSYTMLGVLSLGEAEMTRFSVKDTPLTAMKVTTTLSLDSALDLKGGQEYVFFRSVSAILGKLL